MMSEIKVSISVLDPKVVLYAFENRFERLCRCDTVEQAEEIVHLYNGYVGQHDELQMYKSINLAQTQELADQQKLLEEKDKVIEGLVEASLKMQKACELHSRGLTANMCNALVKINSALAAAKLAGTGEKK